MNNHNKTICIHTLGCKVNRAESDTISGMLEKAGYKTIEDIAPADIYIFNTCAVTNEAERKSRNLITKALKYNPNADIYILGCASQHDASRFKMPNVKKIYGTVGKINVVKDILDDEKNAKCINNNSNLVQKTSKNNKFCENFNTNCKNKVNETSSTFEEIPLPKTKRTRAYLRIQDGCDNFCTYCIIPYVRGRSRSRKFDSVKKEIATLSKYTREIVVTGVNTANYGTDLDEGKTLIDVCDTFNALDNDTRFRISSLEFIKIIDDNFLRRLKANAHFCDQFHLSLQSGSDNVLKTMNRHYTKAEFRRAVKLIRKYFPNAGITTDIIVGFPTETEEDFLECIDTCRKCAFTDIHVFPYSSRSGTVATKMYKILNGDIVDDRKRRMLNLKSELHTAFLSSQIGILQEVLVETTNDGIGEGYSRNFTRCYFHADKNLHGQFLQVRPVRLYRDGVFCDII